MSTAGAFSRDDDIRKMIETRKRSDIGDCKTVSLLPPI
jgi:hypothetical protein